MSAPRRLPFVPPEAIVSPGDHVRCVPYGATVSARVCVRRQRLHGQRVSRQPTGHVDLRSAPGKYRAQELYMGRCADCALGRAVAAQLEGAA